MTQGAHAVPISILRGGTSRGLFFRAADLPERREDIEKVLLNVMGSPDIRQINGLGGATPQTSKVAIVDPSDRDDADVDYTFAQVDITRELVDWGGNCGNISSAVGPFAVDAGIVDIGAGAAHAEVRIHNTNTGKVILAHFPVTEGRADIEGSTFIAGVPSGGPRIELEFLDPTGSVTGVTLPTGHTRDTLRLEDGWKCEFSVVDAANPSVFIDAESFGLSGLELPAELEATPGFLDRIEQVRSVVAHWLGFVADPAQGTAVSPGLPKIGIVSKAREYVSSAGESIAADDYGLAVRMMSMQFPHRACQITGGIGLAVATLIPGTIPHQMARTNPAGPGRSSVVLGHPSGRMELIVRATEDECSLPSIEGVAVVRTARHLLDGVVYVPRALVGT